MWEAFIWTGWTPEWLYTATLRVDTIVENSLLYVVLILIVRTL